MEYLKNNDVEFKEIVATSEFSSIRVGGIARVVAFPRDIKQFTDLLGLLDDTGISYKVVGRATNILFGTSFYNGVIVKTDRLSNDVTPGRQVTLCTGTPFPYALSYLAESGFGGAEALAHIPGSVGGMVCNNAGAFGCEMSDIFLYSDAYDHKKRECVRLYHRDMRFSYRDSILKHEKYTLLSATLGFVQNDPREIKEKIKAFRQKRSSSQPIGSPSLGSVFKRVENVGAGMYIDKAGLRGYRIGGAEISAKHAGFIVNNGGATLQDVLALIKLAKIKVFSAFGISLSEEIEII